MEARLQKLLASAGVGSRRFCEGLITAGRVRVNGHPVTELGAKADAEHDVIEVDGKRVALAVDKVYLVLNKPTGYVTTVHDPHAKHTVMDLVQGVEQRVYPVGRLDADSAGLLILTNDGEFTERLTHPKHQVPKTYRAVVRGEVPAWAAADLRQGIVLDDGMTAPARAEWVDFDEENNASIIDITIHEGRNRQVRRMFDAVGYPVLALTRMSIGPIQLKGIAPGTWRKLHPAEVKALLAAADTSPEARPRVPEPEPEPEPQPREHRPRAQRTPSDRANTQHPRKDVGSGAKPGAPPKDGPATKTGPLSKTEPAPGTRPAPRADGDELRSAARDLTARLRATDRADENEPPARKRNETTRKRK